MPGARPFLLKTTPRDASRRFLGGRHIVREPLSWRVQWWATLLPSSFYSFSKMFLQTFEGLSVSIRQRSDGQTLWISHTTPICHELVQLSRTGGGRIFERDTASSPRAGALGNRRSGFCSCGHGAGARSPSDSPSSALATPRRHRGGPPASPVRDTGGRRTLVRICCWRGVAVSGVGGVPAHFPALPAHAPHHVPPPVLSSLRFERVATSPPSLLPICLLFSPVRPPPYPLCP